MARPTPEVRASVYGRDGNQCVSCGSRTLEFQHRQAVGMGGSKLPPEPEAGLATCTICNTRYERDLQAQALLNGWKVQKWALARLVPVRYPLPAGGFMPGWYRLEDDQRIAIPEDQAMRMMHAVYGPLYLRWKDAA